MDLGIKGKNALVLASSRGLGLGLVTKLCEEGANVMISGRTAERLAAASGALTNAGSGTCRYTVVDFFDKDSANMTGDEFDKSWNKLFGSGNKSFV